MKFTSTRLAGVWLLEIEPIEDERGFFARTFSREEFLAHGLNPHLELGAVSLNHLSGTLRGMHFQKSPHQEAKIVSCIRGAIFDVALDLRPDSTTFKTWFGLELSADNRKMLYIPEGCAHGFQTLRDVSEVSYQISAPYCAPSGGVVRWNDPVFGIQWPQEPRVIAVRDRDASDYLL